MANKNKIKVVIELDSKKYAVEIDKIKKTTTGASGKVKHFSNSLNGARFGMLGVSYAAIRLGKVIVKNGLQFERTARILEYVAGSAEEGAESFEYLRLMSNRLGLDLLSTTSSYAKFAVAVKDSDLENQTRDIFEGFSLAVTGLGLDAIEARGIFKSLEQMASKGNVQAEELRGQLGERLSGALNLAAKALGVTSKELNKMLDMGEVLASDLLPKMAKLLKEQFGEVAVEAAQQGQAAINRMSSAWDVLTAKLYNSDGFVYAASKVTEIFNAVSGTSFRVNIKQTTAEIEKLYKQIEQIQDVNYKIKNNLSGHARLNFDEGKEKDRLIQLKKTEIAEKKKALHLSMLASDNVKYLTIAKKTLEVEIEIEKAKAKSMNPMSRGGNQNKINDLNKQLNDLELRIEAAVDRVNNNEYKSDANIAVKKQREQDTASRELLKESERIKSDFLMSSSEKNIALLEANFAKKRQIAQEHDLLESEAFLEYQENHLLAVQMFADQEVEINRAAQEKKMIEVNRANQTIIGNLNGAMAGIRKGSASYYKSATDSAAQYQKLASSAFSAMEEDLMRFLKTGKLSFSDFAESVIKDLLRIAAQQLAVGLLGMGAPTPLPGTGNIGAGGLHSGGIAGKEFSFTRKVPLSLFEGAKKYHSGGLAGDEVPAILQRGEGVFTTEQMKALSPAKAPVVRVNIINNSDSEATQTETENSDGSTDIDVIIGQVDSALGEKYAEGSGNLFNAIQNR